MTSYERYDQIRSKFGFTNADVSRGTGVADTTISSWKKGTYTPKTDKLQKIADFLGTTVDFLLTGECPKYYVDDEAAQIAQEIFENPTMRILFDASRKVSPDNLEFLAQMAKKLEETNPDG